MDAITLIAICVAVFIIGFASGAGALFLVLYFYGRTTDEVNEEFDRTLKEGEIL